MGYNSTSVKSKWVKTKWLLKRPELSKHVPRTMRFTKKNLAAMLASCSTVYFKPTSGSGGSGIVRITKTSGGYRTKDNSAKTDYGTFELLHEKLRRFAGSRSFLLQKGIRLARTDGKPFDIRVMVQKTDKGRWVSTALFTKIGKPGKVATNYNQGGRIGYFRPTLAGAGYKTDEARLMETKLKRLGVSVGRSFDRHLNGFRELGLDVALDAAGKPWILEVNTRPQFYPLKNMKDKGLYRRIVSYAKRYGRTK